MYTAPRTMTRAHVRVVRWSPTGRVGHAGHGCHICTLRVYFSCTLSRPTTARSDKAETIEWVSPHEDRRATKSVVTARNRGADKEGSSTQSQQNA